MNNTISLFMMIYKATVRARWLRNLSCLKNKWTNTTQNEVISADQSSGRCFFGVAFQSISSCCWCLTDEENSVWAGLRAPWRAIKGVITHWTEKEGILLLMTTENISAITSLFIFTGVSVIIRSCWTFITCFHW